MCVRFQIAYSCGAILYKYDSCMRERGCPARPIPIMYNEECLFPGHVHSEKKPAQYVEVNGRYQQVDELPPGFVGATAERYLRLDLRM